MNLFERKITFFREDGSFDHTKFMELLNKARADLHKKKQSDQKLQNRLMNRSMLIG